MTIHGITRAAYRVEWRGTHFAGASPESGKMTVGIEPLSGATKRVQGLAQDPARRARAAWKMEAWRTRAEQLRIEDPDEYQRILGLARDEGRRLAEKDPDGFVAFVLADSRNPRSTNRADSPG
jgi:hypothetical protein